MRDILTLTYEQVKPVENTEGPGIWGRNQREVQNTAQNSEPTSDSAVRLVAVHPNVRLWTDRRAGSFGEVDGMNEKECEKLLFLCENLACLDANTRTWIRASALQKTAAHCG